MSLRSITDAIPLLGVVVILPLRTFLTARENRDPSLNPTAIAVCRLVTRCITVNVVTAQWIRVCTGNAKNYISQ